MEGRLSISSVLSGAFETVGSNPLSTLGLAFLLGVLPPELFSYFLTGPLARASTLQLLFSPGGFALYGGLMAVSLFCSMLVQATLVRVTVAHAQGESTSLGASLASAMAKILPLLGLTILMTLALGVATLLLIIPGVILYIMWCVASPALVSEDIGIFEAFGRSRALTRGNRWKIFGLLLVLLILIWVFSAIVGVALLATGLTASLVTGTAAGGIPLAYLAITAVSNTLTTAVWSTLVARLYLELRTVKEGPMTESLADVFA